MIVNNIHSIRWADAEHNFVLVVADTDTGIEEQISTPYSNESIIWTWIKDYPQDQILAYVPQPELVNSYISVGAFFDRFGAQKWPILASQDPMVQALIKDVSVRKWVDLDSPQLPGGLDMLIAAGFEIDKNQILTDPIQPHERP